MSGEYALRAPSTVQLSQLGSVQETKSLHIIYYHDEIDINHSLSIIIDLR